MFVLALLVRMPIFVTFGRCEQNFTCKILQVGGEPSNKCRTPKFTISNIKKTSLVKKESIKQAHRATFFFLEKKNNYYGATENSFWYPFRYKARALNLVTCYPRLGNDRPNKNLQKKF